jgi:hypothetical protein
MTNQPTERSQPGHVPGPRGSGCRRAARRLVLLFGLVAIAVPAWAAEVVEVRVGRHPDFTRVVFELDRAAGYRIERSDPASQTSELIVSLEAGSIPRRIQSSKSFIEQVVVEPSGSRSIARIRLAKSGLKLKEMILASPPRIVLDVISEDATSTTASKPSTSTTQAAAATAKTPAPTTSDTATSKPATPTASATTSKLAANGAKPINATAPTAAATKPSTTTGRAGDPLGAGASADARTGAAPSRTPAPETRVLATTDGKGGARASSPNAATPSSPEADALALAQNQAPAGSDEWNDGSAAGDADASAAGGDDLADQAARAPSATPAQADAAAATDKPRERPMMVKTDARDDGPGWMTWALVAVGVAVVGFGALVAVRRRNASAPAESDEGDGAVPFFADAEHEGERAEDDENPFADLATSGTAFGADAGSEAAKAPRTVDRATGKNEKKPSESLLFDDAEETKMEGMEVISRSQTNELGGAMPMMEGGSDEIMQMFREMQRRVAALENRIDELVDARDRLERQVAAQTEELRVQRAAIARTQRAVRNLARNDEGSDDEPTEPALREPN